MSLTDDDKRWINETINGTVNGAIATSETRLTAAIERVETSLLTEFHKWASPLEMRAHIHSTAIHASDLEMEALADRVNKLEPRQSNQQ
jgi:hypothetical protein